VNTGKPISYSARIAALAAEHPHDVALVVAPANALDFTVTWQMLDTHATVWANNLAARGVDRHWAVVIALPNGVEHVFASIAAWRLGALVVVISSQTPPPERAQYLEAVASSGRPIAVFSMAGVAAEGFGIDIHPSDLDVPWDTAIRPDVIAHPGRTVATGGTTGRPKIVVDVNPWVYGGASAMSRAVGYDPGDTVLVCGPLYHGAPALLLNFALLNDSKVVLMERFDASRAVRLIHAHSIQFVFFVPTQMKRVIELPNLTRDRFDSVKILYHTAAFCPPALKRHWIEFLGARRVVELYGANDGLGFTVIGGEEWLARPGSVGRPVGCEICILDEKGEPVETGSIGLVYLRPASAPGAAPVDSASVYAFLGAKRHANKMGGFETVGDLGYVDDDGFLYLVDRRVDMIVSGGANVYPAEVEGVLAEHASVQDVAVIGLPDAEWGRKVHAIILLKPGADSSVAPSLDALVRSRLAPYKVPKTYEFVTEFARNEAGKLQRQKMVLARS
jgi:bile acid-coenzyme A ligase